MQLSSHFVAFSLLKKGKLRRPRNHAPFCPWLSQLVTISEGIKNGHLRASDLSKRLVFGNTSFVIVFFRVWT
jgi:hypothetical protein